VTFGVGFTDGAAPGGTPATTAAIVDDFGGLTVDDDGVMLAHATTASPVTYTAEDCDGVLTAVLDPPRNLTITTTVSAGAYTTGNWTVTSTALDGSTVTETLALTQVNGGETITGNKVHAGIATIARPAMGNGSGSIKIGAGSKVGLRHKPFFTPGGFPYLVPTSSGTYPGDGVTTTIATPTSTPYGAIDYGAAMDGSDLGAMYTEDLS
jgi:hypothetical protein